MSDSNTVILNEIKSAFEQLKSENDTRLSAIESKGSADVLLTEKVDRINDEISELQKKMARPEIKAGDAEQDDHRAAFEGWARKGREGDLSEIESKAVTITGGDASGGFLFPKVVEAGIRETLRAYSPIRSLATVVTVSGDDYRFLTNARGMAVGWVGETDARPETATPTLTETRIPMGELYANPAASQRALDDASFDLEAFFQREIANEMAVAENAAFMSGNGVNKPQGILTTTGLATVKSGVAAGLATSYDPYIAMIYALGAPYRTGAKFLGSAATYATMRTIKDTTGNYIWSPAVSESASQTILGYEAVEVEDSDAVAAGKLPLVFGNVAAGYTIADRIGIRTLRDPFTRKPFVHFYATKRVGGLVTDLKAFVALKIQA